MHSTYIEGKSVGSERSIRILKSRIYKYMPWVTKNVYIDKLDDIVNKHNSTYYNTTKCKIKHIY